MKSILTFFLLCTSLHLFSQQTPALAQIDDTQFSIQYPSNWKVDRSGGMGTTFVLFCDGQADAKFNDNFNLIIQDIAAYNLDLAQYTAISEEQIKNMITAAQIVASKRIEDKQGPYQEVIYTGELGIYKLKWKQWYRLKNGKAFVLTFSGSQDTFDKQLNNVDQVLKSFIMK